MILIGGELYTVRRARDRHADYYAIPSADVKVDYWRVIP